MGADASVSPVPRFSDPATMPRTPAGLPEASPSSDSTFVMSKSPEIILSEAVTTWVSYCARVIPWRCSTLVEAAISRILLSHLPPAAARLTYETILRHHPTPSSLRKATRARLAKLIRSESGTRRILALEVRRLIQLDKKVTTADESISLSDLPSPASRVLVRFFGSRERAAESLSAMRRSPVAMTALAEFGTRLCAAVRPGCAFCPVSTHCSSSSPGARHSKPTALDLYSGAGGLSLGAMNAGADVVYAFEHDSQAAATYENNFPRTPVVKTDLMTVSPGPFLDAIGIRPGTIDVVIAGPPCQGFSISNRRTRNATNQQNFAWRSVVKFVRILKPRAVLIENVTGIETFREGRVLTNIKRSLSRLGYAVTINRLNSAAFGVPQKRTRIFIVATQQPCQIAEPPITRPITVGMALNDLPRLAPGNDISDMPYRHSGRKLNAFQRLMRRSSTHAKNSLTSGSTPLILRRFAAIPQGGNWQHIPEALFKTYACPANCHRWLYLRLSPDAPSVTISNFRKNMIIHPWENRTLSVREAARLQAIPDRFEFCGSRQSQQQQVANAVPPPLASAAMIATLASISCAAKHG
jgi:DNA (cytosine-5)-methyltransferase 1